MSRTDFSRSYNRFFECKIRDEVKIYYGAQYAPQPGPPQVIQRGLFRVYSGSRSGTTAINYYKRRLKGEYIGPNNFTYQEINYSPQVGSTRRVTHSQLGSLYSYDTIRTVTGCVSDSKRADYANAMLNPVIPINQQNASKQKALLKIKDQDVNLLEVWGERKETIDMIRNNVNRIGRAASNLRKGNWGEAASALGVKLRSGLPSKTKGGSTQSKAFANGWLELQYGWRPLIQDVYGGAEFLRKQGIAKRWSLSRVSANSSFANNSSRTVPYQTIGQELHVLEAKVDVKTVIHYVRNSSTLPTLTQLGITNPLYLGWELTKYSFVVDWFAGIGDFLSALDAPLGYTFAGGSVTTAQRASETVTWSVSGKVDSQTTDTSSFTEKEEIFQLSRTVLSSWPIATLPAFKDPQSMEHALNAIALLKQSMR